ncbi:hypothetical protein [Caballeronia choica]|uniref:hypothetical protein n=1 Tax=Caballeronia choica TaxID=326476 RepID=UPI000A54E9E1|nr:hypothetical protein [Caballeronia choica]
MADYAKPLVADSGFGSRDLPMSTVCGGMVISTDAADQTLGLVARKLVDVVTVP